MASNLDVTRECACCGKKNPRQQVPELGPGNQQVPELGPGNESRVFVDKCHRARCCHVFVVRQADGCFEAIWRMVAVSSVAHRTNVDKALAVTNLSTRAVEARCELTVRVSKKRNRVAIPMGISQPCQQRNAPCIERRTPQIVFALQRLCIAPTPFIVLLALLRLSVRMQPWPCVAHATRRSRPR